MFENAYRSARLKHLTGLEKGTVEFSLNFFIGLDENISIKRFKNVNVKSLGKIIIDIE